ncbi:hypothetical protein U1737_13445 [Sphingomonas sp. LB3N6]|uniref:hypothetical protein n=1 Tax=Sphingomonas fucosidasi TaxID=3096164 RepID=UPI002FC788A6
MPGRTTPASSKTSKTGVGWLIAIVGGLFLIGNISKCSSRTSTASAADVAISDSPIKTLNSAVAAQTPPPIEALNAAGASIGFANMRKAVSAEGLSGAMIYSQNCYDALSRAFSWRRLDVCGAAYLKAIASVPEDDITAMSREIAYFQSEVAAARYLGAVTGAGASAAEADERIAAMQARLPAAKPAEAVEVIPIDPDVTSPDLETPANADAVESFNQSPQET